MFCFDLDELRRLEASGIVGLDDTGLYTLGRCSISICSRSEFAIYFPTLRCLVVGLNDSVRSFFGIIISSTF